MSATEPELVERQHQIVAALKTIRSEREQIRSRASTHDRQLRDSERRSIEDHDENEQQMLADLDDIRSQIDELREARRRQQASAEISRKLTPPWDVSGDESRGHAGAEMIYRADSPHSYFLDRMNATNGDVRASERLERHAKVFNDSSLNPKGKELRAGGTTVNGAGGEFAPPLWLVDQFISVLRPARATANTMSLLPLPEDASSVQIPKISTGTLTAQQATQNTQIASQDITTTSLSSPTYTIAGGNAFSLQLFEQSPLKGAMDRVILSDLVNDYAKQVGNAVINGGGGAAPTGLLNVAGSTTVTYTSGTPTVQLLMSKIAQAQVNVQTSRYDSATVISMHPRRWQWLCVQPDTTGRPMVLPTANGAMNSFGIVSNGQAQGEVGSMLGATVVVDPNIPTNLGAGTNQDVVIVFKSDDSWLWEGEVRSEVFRETFANTLSLYARVYNYLALIHRYPQSINLIQGTGLVAPTF